MHVEPDLDLILQSLLSSIALRGDSSTLILLWIEDS